MNSISKIVAISTFATLSACGSGTLSPSEKFTQSGERFLAMAETVSGYSPTAFNAMPTTGSAQFNGYAGIVVDPNEVQDSDDIVLVGDLDVEVDFQDAALTGSMSNMTGSTNLTETGADYFDVEGQFNIGTRLSIVGDDEDDNFTNRPNDWAADMNGSVSTPEGTIGIDALLQGQFMGTRVNNPNNPNPIRGLGGISNDNVSYATLNGVEVPVYISVVAED